MPWTCGNGKIQYNIVLVGELSEWSMVVDLKSTGCQSPRGSNPLLSAKVILIFRKIGVVF